MPKIDEDKKRRPCFGKVSPETRAYLDQMPESNDGRKIDRLVEILLALKKAKKSR